VTPEYSPGSTAQDQGHAVSAVYGTGSWSGEAYTDQVSVGSETPINLEFADISSQKQFFTPNPCNSPTKGQQGILGLGPAGAAVHYTEGYFTGLQQDQHITNMFATMLCDTGGTLWLGGYDSSVMTAPPQYTPFVGPDMGVAYTVNLASITIGGSTVAIASSANQYSIADTGTNVWVMTPSVASTIETAVKASADYATTVGTNPSFFNQTFECLSSTITKDQLDAALPSVTLTFGSGSSAIQVTALPTESYIMNLPQQGWCNMIDVLNPSPNVPFASVLGATILRSNVFIFDVGNKRLGIAPHKPCP
jgi:hypothetical protein